MQQAPHQGRRVEGRFNQGWGVAIAVILFAVVANVVATRIHFAHYRPGNAVGSNGGEHSRADNAPMGH
jgi:hypothetical protein